MKLVEELEFGDCFYFGDDFFIVTTDFKKNNDKLCVSLSNGSTRWIKSNAIVDTLPIYRLDKDNNIIPFKIIEKTDDTLKN